MEDLDVSGNNLKTVGAKNCTTDAAYLYTKKLCLSNTNIGYKAADDIAAVISCNIHLEELDIANSNFMASGVIKLKEDCKRFPH